MRGFAGNDYLYGYGGADMMYGGTGNDAYYVDTMQDKVIEYAYEGTDHVYSSVSTSYKWLPANVENLTLIGTAYYGDGNDLSNYIYGNGSTNSLSGYGGYDYLYGYGGNDYLYGGVDNDTLDGGTGADTMYGGTGHDTYYVGTMSDKVIEYADQGTDHVYSSVSTSYKWLPANVENLTLTGTAYWGDGNDLNNSIYGNGSANSLRGYGGTDRLLGGDGKDYLYGGDGKDDLTGGLGKDHIWGGEGEDWYVYSSISESPEGAGRDVIHDFEGGYVPGGDVIDLSQIDGNAWLTGHQDLTCPQITWSGGVLNVDVWNYGDNIDMQIEVAGLNCSDIYTYLLI
jgi:Ca2+-binding RTX toxin-like protein